MPSKYKSLGGVYNPGFKWNPSREGYRDYEFGCSAGPDINFSHLAHELGHAAEFGPDMHRYRNIDGRFLFKNSYVVVLGKRYVEPKTDQSTERELRTIAHQIRIMKMCGVKASVDYLVNQLCSSLKYMTDSYNVPGDDAAARAQRNAIRVKEYLQAGSDYDTINRLFGWLDKTNKRLKRLTRV